MLSDCKLFEPSELQSVKEMQRAERVKSLTQLYASTDAKMNLRKDASGQTSSSEENEENKSRISLFEALAVIVVSGSVYAYLF